MKRGSGPRGSTSCAGANNRLALLAYAKPTGKDKEGRGRMFSERQAALVVCVL